MAFLDPIFNPLMQPLLDASPFLAILVLSFLISIIITLVYKLVTNQNEMKSLKEKQKEYQQRMKELRSDPQKMMSVQKEAMQLNMKYMKMSFKPTLITMIPLLLIFGWMSAHFAFEPINPGESYSVTAFFSDSISGNAKLMVNDNNTKIINGVEQPISKDGVTWNLKSEAGTHYLTVKTDYMEQTKKVLVTTDNKYEEALTVYDHSDITKININYNALKPLGYSFSLFGWKPGWLGIYIILSIVFSMALRKLLKIY